MKFKLPKYNIHEKILLIAIALNLFSFWPSISINQKDSSDVELAMLSGVLVVVYSLFAFRKKWKSLISIGNWWMVAGWAVYGIVLSLALTSNLGSNILRSGYLLSIVAASYLVYWQVKNKKIRLNYIINGWVILASIFAILAIAQFMLDSLGIATLIRDRYSVGTFSFPRAHAFSIEPLFFANWLLPPLLFQLNFIGKKVNRYSSIIASVIIIAFLLTLSRGAFYGAAVAILIFFFVNRGNVEYIKRIVSVSLISIFVALLFVGFSSSMNGSSFTDGAGRYLDHATLGVFNIEGATNIEPEEVETTPGVFEESFAPSRLADKEGVVEASTQVRLETNRYGYEILTDSPKNFILGIGLFRFGEEVSERTVDILQSDKILTNNQLFDIWIETGLIGVLLWLGFLWNFRKTIISNVLLFSVFAALLVQFLSFSGYFLIPFWIVLALLVSSNHKEIKQL